MMRMRNPFAGGFAVLVLISGYLGFAPINIPTGPVRHSDKGLHFITFFLLSLTFYWIFETTRRRAFHFTVSVCTVALGCGSEVVQGLLPNGRSFDAFDVLANVLGSLAAIGLSTWYHKRMLERKRAVKNYQGVPGDEETGGAGIGDEIELTEGMEPQESGVTSSGQREGNLDTELENWDENAEDDWDQDEANMANGGYQKPKTPPPGEGERKKRDD